VKNGFFEGNLDDLKLIFQANIERSAFLEETIKNLKEKILEAYCRLAPESNLLQELINAELNYRRAKEQNLSAVEFRKQRDKIRNKLEEKLTEEQMEEVEFILTDCEKLVINDLELEAIIIRTDKVIEEAKIRMISINISGEIKAHQGNIVIGNIISEAKEKIENLSIRSKISAVNTENGHTTIGCNVVGNSNFNYTNQQEITNDYSGTFTSQDSIMLIGNQQFRDKNNLVINKLPEEKKIE
jgi:hypothetical protein